MIDDILAFLQQARAEALQDRAKSRELSLVITKIDEAILWRQADLRLKAPTVNEASERPAGA